MKRREICAILNMGCSRKTAAKYVGCSVDTIRNTARRDEQFRTQLRKAESNLEINQLRNIQDAAKKYWQAAAWVLERKYPEHYARRDPKQITLTQVSNLLAQLADIIVEEVPVPEYRRAILKRVQSVTLGLQSAMATGKERKAGGSKG